MARGGGSPGENGTNSLNLFKRKRTYPTGIFPLKMKKRRKEANLDRYLFRLHQREAPFRLIKRGSSLRKRGRWLQSTHKACKGRGRVHTTYVRNPTGKSEKILLAGLLSLWVIRKGNRNVEGKREERQPHTTYDLKGVFMSPTLTIKNKKKKKRKKRRTDSVHWRKNPSYGLRLIPRRSKGRGGRRKKRTPRSPYLR